MFGIGMIELLVIALIVGSLGAAVVAAIIIAVRRR